MVDKIKPNSIIKGNEINITDAKDMEEYLKDKKLFYI